MALGNIEIVTLNMRRILDKPTGELAVDSWSPCQCLYSVKSRVDAICSSKKNDHGGRLHFGMATSLVLLLPFLNLRRLEY